MEDLDQLLEDLQSVSQRARTAYKHAPELTTRLEPMVLNRTLPTQNVELNQLNLTRPDSTLIESSPLRPLQRVLSPPPPSSSQPTQKSLNELNQLLETLNNVKQNIKQAVSPSRLTSNDKSTSLDSILALSSQQQQSNTVRGVSIDDLIESIDIQSEISPTTKQKPTSSKQKKSKSTVTKELEDLMASLSDFKISSTLKEQTSPTHLISTSQTRSTHSPDSDQKSTSSSPSKSKSTTSTSIQLPVTQLNEKKTKSDTNLDQYPKCHACNHSIVGQVITVLDRYYHPEHLRCTACNCEIGRKDFYEKNSRPYCENDYRRLFAPKCAACDQPIISVMITALNRNWHPEHFVCELCKRRVGDDGYHEKDSKAYCRECYLSNFVPKCLGCDQAIIDTYIQALGGHWHKRCFVCQQCEQPFVSGTFYEHENIPLCELHYHQRRGSLCSACQKPIGYV
ncbi:unnamed protein product [Didymodactylos carnosus]|uniref:LIM zinc-binding domain-containing protein n=1 Tax=Didymodactylos carnosus TaxID=1234261 RepID=A0A8S2DUW1_9BILA|nr:unnamed protein product [Didymodactylos carnosus]CAF3744604.1 unnamed protein product [Didymodactylos carnosus]